MKINFERWAIGCVLGCALVGVTLLPPDFSRDYETYNTTIPARRHEAVMQDRANVRYNHAREMWSAYSATLATDAAHKAFGSLRGSSGEPVISFGADVPESIRRTLERQLAVERATRGEWHGRGPVGVLVLTDTVTSLDGQRLNNAFGSVYSVTSQVYPATAANGEHCVTVIRLGHLALKSLSGIDPLPPRSNLLDACVFYDAFGAPGPEIRKWLEGESFAYARQLDLAPPDSLSPKIPAWAKTSFYSNELAAAKCSGGEDDACFKSISRRETLGLQDGGADFDLLFYGGRYWQWNDLSAPRIPRSTIRGLTTTQSLNFDASLLQSLVQELGPARFQHMWQSQKALPDAYFEVTGQPFPAWLRRHMLDYSGTSYRIGPLPNPSAAIITLAAVLAMLAISLRWASRPYAM